MLFVIPQQKLLYVTQKDIPNIFLVVNAKSKEIVIKTEYFQIWMQLFAPMQISKIKMTNQIPLDYMHVVLLGVTKRLIHLWLDGP